MSLELELRIREMYLSVHSYGRFQVCIISRQSRSIPDAPELLTFQFFAAGAINRRLATVEIENSRKLAAISVLELRTRISSELIQLISAHAVRVHQIYQGEYATLVESTASLYKKLTHWGETSAAKVIAEVENVPIRTIHSRLLNARKKGILDSPGAGFRY